MNRIAWLLPSLHLLIAALVLAPAACTRDYTLGAVDAGGLDVTETVTDAPVETTVDSPIEILCQDHGVLYHVGDVIPRGTAACPISCVCLEGAVVGRCTGACPPDASADGVAQSLVATIVYSRSTNSPEIDVLVFSDGSAERTVIEDLRLIIPDAGPTMSGSPRTYPAGSPEVTQFLADLAAVPDLAATGDPGLSIGGERCPKSVSFGTRTTVTAGEVTSGDLQCLSNPTAAQTALANDAMVLTGGDIAFTLRQCAYQGGYASSALCCTSEGDLPDTCGVGACACSPADSHSVTTCQCPAGSCYLRAMGACVQLGPPGVCTVGQDQTCNDNPQLSSLHGSCLTGGRCACGSFGGLAASGKCL